MFFDDSLPFYANRVEESFELHYHDHEFTEINYVAEGTGFHYVGDETVSVTQGELFILPLGTSHVYRPRSADARDPLVIYNFIFVPDRVADAIRHVPFLEEMPETLGLLNLAPGRPTWRKLRDRAGAFRSFFEQAHRELHRRQTGFIPRVYGLFLSLIAEIERTLRAESSDARAERSGWAQAMAFVESSYADRITARQAAAEAGVSTRHFHRLFVRETGSTFSEFLQKLRIEKSRELLTGTRLSVQEIAEAVGYQDKKHFLELFKRTTGLTPREYRSGK
nr:AraC family transcriptional regulator [Cohnella sp. CFH 77786]